MLTTDQITYLCFLADLTSCQRNNQVLYITDKADQSANLTIPFNDFQRNMGLEDLRLHWLTTTNAFIAGGAVLNWALREQQNEDIDFFFTDVEVGNRFEAVICNYFKLCRETMCAKTYQNESVILQLVGTTGSPYQFFGSPVEVLNRFDMDLCKWAADCNNVYTTNWAIRDAITKSLHYKEDCQIKYVTQSSMQRLFKYSRKGFYASDTNTWKV